ncbi:MAG: TetR/AcrR family transcriptional regulator [Lachnospiraceae bacterium]|nr:TetR/AcrR family transcriptional regulator [Lachnospiraceae bacterium]
MVTPTQEKIQQVAMQHFLRDGFKSASLRKIVAESGFTSGAFYGYYKKKEDLFDALVKETADGIIALITEIGDSVEALPTDQAFIGMSDGFKYALPKLLDYLFEHIDEVRLLFKCSEGTKYNNFLSGVMSHELEFWKEYTGKDFPISPLAANLLVNSYFRLLGDAVLSDESREEIAKAMQNINNIYIMGMANLIKEHKENETL